MSGAALQTLLTPAGPVLPRGQVLALLMTSKQGLSFISVQILKSLSHLWLIGLASAYLVSGPEMGGFLQSQSSLLRLGHCGVPWDSMS